MTWTWSKIQSIEFLLFKRDLSKLMRAQFCVVFVCSHRRIVIKNSMTKWNFYENETLNYFSLTLFLFCWRWSKTFFTDLKHRYVFLSPNLFWSQTLSICVSSSVVQGEKQLFFINACLSSSLGFMTRIYCLIINLGRTSGRKCCFKSFLYR